MLLDENVTLEREEQLANMYCGIFVILAGIFIFVNEVQDWNIPLLVELFDVLNVVKLEGKLIVFKFEHP